MHTRPSFELALVEDLDNQLGRFMKQLNAWKLMENTLVIFITDNGPNTGGYKKDGKASGVKLSDGRTIKSDIVVSNADPGWTYKNLIKKSSKSRWTDKRLSQSKEKRK